MEGSSIRISALFLAAFVFVALAGSAQFAHAKLIGTDREEFIAEFERSCYQSIGSRELIMSFGGGPAELEKYCACVARIYADNLDIESIKRVTERRRKQIADVSREVCVERVF